MKRTAIAALALAGAMSGHASASTITFESPALGTESYSDHGPITESGVTLSNTVTDFGGGFYVWSGFARSTTTDTSTADYTNYSAITGGGAGASSTYALGYHSAYDPLPTLTFDGYRGLVGDVEITNATYAALSMQEGDFFAKKFGGPTGDEPDYLLLTISGFASGALTGSVEFYLADFRSSDNSQDYIIHDWTTVNLSSLGWVNELRFSLTSSDVGVNGINTPTYFAVDNIQFVPEPSAALLSLFGLLPLLRRKR